MRQTSPFPLARLALSALVLLLLSCAGESCTTTRKGGITSSGSACGGCLSESPVAGTLKVEFAGMIDLVSDKTGTSPAWVLAPNATDPKAFKSYLPSQTFSPPHWPILQLHAGKVVSVTGISKSAYVPCSTYLGGASQAWDLLGFVVTTDLANTGRVAQDRSPVGLDPLKSTSLVLLADMDTLATSALIKAGSIDSDLLTMGGVDVAKVLATRWVLQQGKLRIPEGWVWNQRRPKPKKAVHFDYVSHPNIGVQPYAQYLGSRLLWDVTSVSSLTLSLQGLDGKSSGKIELEDVGDGIYLRFINSPVEPRCRGAHHFAAHYLLREKLFGGLPYIYEPSVTGGANDNPQCSPGDNTP